MTGRGAKRSISRRRKAHLHEGRSPCGYFCQARGPGPPRQVLFARRHGRDGCGGRQQGRRDAAGVRGREAQGVYDPADVEVRRARQDRVRCAPDTFPHSPFPMTPCCPALHNRCWRGQGGGRAGRAADTRGRRGRRYRGCWWRGAVAGGVGVAVGVGDRQQGCQGQLCNHLAREFQSMFAAYRQHLGVVLIFDFLRCHRHNDSKRGGRHAGYLP